MDRPHQDKNVLITGGGRGIGAATARRLASEGAHVTLTYVGSPAEANKVVDEIAAKGGQARAIEADARKIGASAGAVATDVADQDSLDIFGVGCGHQHIKANRQLDG